MNAGKLGANIMHFKDEDFLIWLENRVKNTNNTQKLKVKLKHMRRLFGIISPGSALGHGGSMKLEFLSTKIDEARGAIAQRVADKLTDYSAVEYERFKKTGVRP